MIKIVTAIIALLITSTAYAAKLTTTEFDIKYQAYQNQLFKDQQVVKKYKSDDSAVGLVKYNQVSCKIIDDQTMMYKVALENKHIPRAVKVADELGSYLMHYQQAQKSMGNKSYKKVCEDINRVAERAGIQ